MSSHRSGTRSPGSLMPIPVNTPVEVRDENKKWYSGGVVVAFDEEAMLYTISWGDEETTAEMAFVRRVKTEWHKVKHGKTFDIKCKGAPYLDWLEQQAPYIPPPEPEEDEDEAEETESAAPEEKWRTPTRKQSDVPEWKSELRVPKKKKPTWERNIRKYEKSQILKMKERPAFGVTRKAAWEPWKTSMSEIRPKKENKRMMKFWGRFAPEDSEEEATEEPMTRQPRVQKAQRRVAEEDTQEVEEEAQVEEAQIEEAQVEDVQVEEVEPEQEQEQEPVQEEVQEKEEEAVVEEPVEAEQEVSEAVEEPEQEAQEPEQEEPVQEDAEIEENNDGGLADLAAAVQDAITPTPTSNASPTSPMHKDDEPSEPPSNIPVDLSPESQKKRQEIFDKLLEPSSVYLSASYLKTALLETLDMDNTYQAGVVKATEAAKKVSQVTSTEDINRPEFRVLLVSLNRYIAVSQKLEVDVSEEAEKVMEPEQFERAIPLLSKWGCDMDDIEQAFGSDMESQITYGAFVEWAIKQGLTECTES
eukprot:TRINITY_DN37315_c0_g1_i1.p1 TRINITY_DN37315_c0_g1~~TRINITY_DN37315_c0_g1_i1.p1  ORF type:complete len:529 (+),score=205.01 TRINITY_DN37315_c0_g1_i1:60-1646(+)